MLAELAVADPSAFSQLVGLAREALPAEVNAPAAA
jgi:large subunit ribosomal protein L20